MTSQIFLVTIRIFSDYNLALRDWAALPEERGGGGGPVVAAEAGAALLLRPAVLAVLQTLASTTEVRVVVSLKQQEGTALEAHAAVAGAAVITVEAEGSK